MRTSHSTCPYGKQWFQRVRVLIILMSFVDIKAEDRFKCMEKNNELFLKMVRTESAAYEGQHQSKKLLLQ